MKTKFLLVALFAFLFSANFATAQNPHWLYLGSNVDTNDIYGNPVNLFDTLSSGKAVLLCLASTQNQESFALHQSGILEAVHNQLGDSICVLWVEADSSTTVADILGIGSHTLCNWTQTSNGNPVHYRLIDCPTIHVHCEHEESSSELFFISPLHHFCEPLEEHYGFDINSDTDTVIARLRNLLSIYPRHGVPPTVDIFGPTELVADVYYHYFLRITSIDELSDITWYFEGGDPPTSTLSSPFVTWHTPGTYNVQLSATNTSGTTVVTLPVTVADGWQWGDTISYCGNDAFMQSIGTNDTSFSWGIKIPSRYMENRTFLTATNLFVEYPGHYTLNLYQGGDEVPESLVYSHEVTITAAHEWVEIPVQGNYRINPDLPLWITFQSSDVAYPATYAYYSGDRNGSYCYVNENWQSVLNISQNLEATWMIKAVTAHVDPPFDITIDGPDHGIVGESYTFAANGPEGSLFDWLIPGGVIDSIGETAATAHFNEPGEYTISATGTLYGSSISATHTIMISDTSTQQINFQLSTFNFQLSIYPNPTDDIINIVGDGIQHISVINATGQTVISCGAANQLSLKSLNSGIYIIRLITTTGTYSQKIHIIHNGTKRQ